MITEMRGEIDKLIDKWRRDHRAANDARVEGGTALFAVSQDSPEGDIQAATQRAAWASQIKLMEQKEHRILSDGLLLAQLRRNIRDLDAAEAKRQPTPENMTGRRLADFGPVGAASGLLGAFGGVRLWMVLAGGMALTTGAAALQTARLDHAKHDLSQTRADLRAMEASRNAYAGQLAQDRAQHARDVAHVLEDTARTVEQLERRQARQRALAERERHRHEELATGSIDFSERLRELAAPPDAGLPAGGTAAPRGGAASAMPAQPGADSHAQPPQQ